MAAIIKAGAGLLTGRGKFMNFLGVLGSVGGILGIIGFHRHPMVEKDPHKSVVRIATGLEFKGGLAGSAGDVPEVRIFAENGHMLGKMKKRKKVGDGEYKELDMKHKKNSNKQATYMILNARPDPLCVAYVTITFPDDWKYAWTGDWAQLCEPYSEDPIPWYYSNLYMDNENYSPHCMWMGQEGKTFATGVQLHFLDFLAVEEKHGNMTEAQRNEITKDICTNGYSFLAHREPRYKKLHLGPAKGVTPPHNKIKIIEAREESPIGPQPKPPSLLQVDFTDKLVKDNGTLHSARSLCESRSSRGPDFVNTAEGLFCDMDAHKLWPICGNDKDDKCFNPDSNQLIVGGKATKRVYSQLLDWTRP